MKGPLFYSKILLFGEYGIIKDSKGLSIPYSFYNGALKKDDNPSEHAIISNKNLKSFVNYLETIDVDLVSFDSWSINFFIVLSSFLSSLVDIILLSFSTSDFSSVFDFKTGRSLK